MKLISFKILLPDLMCLLFVCVYYTDDEELDGSSTKINTMTTGVIYSNKKINLHDSIADINLGISVPEKPKHVELVHKNTTSEMRDFMYVVISLLIFIAVGSIRYV